jgi:hypothetical protein
MDDDSGGDNVSAGFIAGMIAMVLVAFGGMYFIFGGSSSGPGGQRDAYVSSVDRACSQGWEKEKSNVDQMHCYLTIDVRRLCDPMERRHLVATVERFQDDYRVWNQRFFAAAMGTAAKARGHSMEIGLQDAKMQRAMRDPNATEEERAEHMNKMMGMVDNVMSGTNKLLAERRNETPFYKLEDEIKHLASKGYIQADDFGSRPPHWVARGLKAVKSVRPACSN